MNIGDVVYHKLTGLKMMVISAEAISYDSMSIICEWQDRNGKWESRRFPQGVLTTKKPKKPLGIK